MVLSYCFFLFYNRIFTLVISKIFRSRIEIITNVTFLIEFFLLSIKNKRHFSSDFFSTIFSLFTTSSLLDSFFPPTSLERNVSKTLESEFQSKTILDIDLSLATSTFARSFFHGFVLVSFPGSRRSECEKRAGETAGQTKTPHGSPVAKSVRPIAFARRNNNTQKPRNLSHIDNVDGISETCFNIINRVPPIPGRFLPAAWKIEK